MSPERFLSHLEGVKANGRDAYVARCPAHDDRSPSLSVRFLADGRILLHCHAGCEPVTVVGAMGLRMGDLFPQHGLEGWFRSLSPEGKRDRERKLEDELAREEAILAITRSDIHAGKRVAPAESARAKLAAARVRQLRERLRRGHA